MYKKRKYTLFCFNGMYIFIVRKRITKITVAAHSFYKEYTTAFPQLMTFSKLLHLNTIYNQTHSCYI